MAGVPHDPVALQQLVQTEQAHKCLKNVCGSPPYWQNEWYNVLAMLRSLGLPTWFLTVSAADLHWPEMTSCSFTVGPKYLRMMYCR